MSQRQVHEIKEWPESFGKLLSGQRKNEVRFNDRNYQIGDGLHVREWNPHTEEYSGRECLLLITSVHEPANCPGYVVMDVAPHAPVVERVELTEEGQRAMAEASAEAAAGTFGAAYAELDRAVEVPRGALAEDTLFETEVPRGAQAIFGN